MSYQKYTNESVIDAVKKSNNWREVMSALNPSILYSGSYHNIKKRAKLIGADFRHFTNLGNKKGGKKRRTTEQLMQSNSTSSHILRKRLLSDGLKDDICEKCQQTHWMGLKIPLELHHINHNPSDNNISNLQILCPNCHSLTHSETSRIVREEYKKNRKLLDKRTTRRSRPELRKVERPSAEKLYELVWEMPSTEVAKKYGVSDRLILKWCDSYNINKPPRGYWTKMKHLKN